MLGNSDQSRLMVGCCVDRGELVGTRWETPSDTCGKDAIAVRGSVETFEEREHIGIRDSGRVQGVNLLNHNM